MARRRESWLTPKLIAPVEPVAPPPVALAETQSARIEPPTRAQPQPFILPAVIEPTPAGAMDDLRFRELEESEPSKPSPLPANVLPFAAKAKPPARGRRKKTGDQAMRVDYVKVSKNTWAFRIRWKEGEQEPAVYVSRVDDKRFKSITKGKVRYAAFKKQLISSYLSRTVRQGHGIDASPNRTV
ncbi:MAG: hypothetical protein SF097_25400 [Acidobacteriota bacterium]|nr:hypothetical protein [Acidobacteriota bacterium]